jgi:hypothetical protein
MQAVGSAAVLFRLYLKVVGDGELMVTVSITPIY